MDKEDFVTYKQALALKKLGFDIPVNHYYTEEGILEEIFYDAETDDSYNDPTSYSNLNQYYKNYTLNLSAPTLAQVQKWLRKEKDLYVLVNNEIVTEDRSKFFWDISDEMGWLVDKLSSEAIFDTYEEALSEGITECLKLLENE